MKQIFISHNTESDGDFANRLAGDLERLEVDVWIAPSSIRPGEEWIDAIGRGMEESTHFTLVSTPRAYDSSWVRKEYNVALMLEADNQIEVIPLEVEKAKIPLFLRVFQFIRFSEGYESGLQRLAETLGVVSQLDHVGFAADKNTQAGSKLGSGNEVRPPPTPSEPRVFVAYDVRDREYAHRLSNFLEAHGIKRWMAPESIQPGARWGVALVDGVLNSTAMVVIMSPDSSRSRWVQEELRIAGREGIPVFPILLAGQPFESLRQYQFVDARGGEMPPQRLVERLKARSE